MPPAADSVKILFPWPRLVAGSFGGCTVLYHERPLEEQELLQAITNLLGQLFF